MTVFGAEDTSPRAFRGLFDPRGVGRGGGEGLFGEVLC